MDITLDSICEKLTTTEAINAVHACREGHPLGYSYSKSHNFENAWFLVAYHLGAGSPEAEWLNKQTINHLKI